MWLRGKGTTKSEVCKWVSKHVIAGVRVWYALARGAPIQGPRRGILGSSTMPHTRGCA